MCTASMGRQETTDKRKLLTHTHTHTRLLWQGGMSCDLLSPQATPHASKTTASASKATAHARKSRQPTDKGMWCSVRGRGTRSVSACIVMSSGGSQSVNLRIGKFRVVKEDTAIEPRHHPVSDQVRACVRVLAATTACNGSITVFR